MDCSALAGLLPQIVTGRLSAAAAERLGAHIRGCSRCAERVEKARAGLKTPTDRVPAFEAGPLRSSEEELPSVQAGGDTIKYGSESTRPADELVPGVTIGGYVIVREIARGGMGIVYRATQKQMNRPVAIKVLPHALLDDEELVLRFIREARAAAELNHPNVVRVYDIGRDAGWVWYSMELVSGRSLKELIKSEGRLAPARAVDVALGCAHALEAAEAHGIVHRDVKPDNLLITEDGQVKLADLGLVRHSTRRGTAELTQAGDLLGTPSYMAPEQARDSRVADNRSDLWSLGATLYHALFGVPPFVAKTAMEIVSRVLKEEVRFPPESETLPRELRATLRQLLAKDPAERFQRATDVVKALERCRREVDRRTSERRLAVAPKIHRASSSPEQPAARTIRRRRARRRDTFLPVAILGALGLGGVVLIAVHRPPPPERLAEDRETPVPPAPQAPSSLAARDATAPSPGAAREASSEDLAGVASSDEATLDSATRPLEDAPRPLVAWIPERARVDELARSTDLGALAAWVDSASRAGGDPALAAARERIEARLRELRETRDELVLESALGAALDPLRHARDHASLAAARSAAARAVAPIASDVAAELGDALDAAERLLELAEKGLGLDVADAFTPRDGRKRTGAYALEGTVARSGNDMFRFPDDCPVDALRALAWRDKAARDLDLRRLMGAWSLVGGDLGDAVKRLEEPGASRPLKTYARLHTALWKRGHYARLPVLELADMLWASGPRATAVQLYQRALADPDVLEADERRRATERITPPRPAPPQPPAPTETKRAWDFRGAAQADGLPDDWTTAESLGWRRHAGGPPDGISPRRTPEGLVLQGLGRIIATPAWSQQELQLDVEAILEGGTGLGITVGEYPSEEGHNVFVVGGYGIRLGPRDRAEDMAAATKPRDGLWVIANGFFKPEALHETKGYSADRPSEEGREGPVTLRLVLKRQETRFSFTLARIKDGKGETISDALLTEHLPPAKAPLRAGLVVSGRRVTIERFLATAR